MPKHSIYICGDSTAARYGSDRSPMAGWGQMLAKYLTEDIEVVNRAICGRSSKSFIGEKRLEHVLSEIQSGDYLFIQFGHNDQKPDEERRTEPFSTYEEHLRQYIDGASAKGAHPVLLTSVNRRRFNENGEFYGTHGDYLVAMRQLAEEAGVPLLDVAAKSEAKFRELGPDRSRELFCWLKPGESPNYPEGSEDDTHFNEYGAEVVAGWVAELLRDSTIELKEFLRK
jgi:lysophospholipase L1-like esterase